MERKQLLDDLHGVERSGPDSAQLLILCFKGEGVASSRTRVCVAFKLLPFLLHHSKVK